MIMDKNFSSVGTQYIICECGDNFPNENFLSIHLANGHGEVDTFLCDACPEAFTSENLLLQHRLTHKPETPKKPELTTQKSPQVTLEKKKEYVKKPPVIKVQNLKKINSISLIQNLKTYGRFIKLEPEPPEPAEATVPAEVELVEEPAQVVVKLEEGVDDEGDAEDSTEEIYYQCDVCNAIFYTELDFNVHYQSLHAIKLEAQSTEEILEEHLVTDHADDATVKAGRDTVYYYECEVGKERSVITENPAASATLENVTGTNQPALKIDSVQSLTSTDKQGNKEEVSSNKKECLDTDRTADSIKNKYVTDSDLIESPTPLDTHDLLKVTHTKEIKRMGRPKKKKKGRPPKEDVYANLPIGLTHYQAQKLAEERKKEIRREQQREARKRYLSRNPEAQRIASAKYAKAHPEAHRKAAAKYAKAHPEVNRKASAKYAKAHPEVHRKAVAKYAKAHPEVNRKSVAKYAKAHREEWRNNSAEYHKRPENKGRAAKRDTEKSMEALKFQDTEIQPEVYIKEEILIEIEPESILGEARTAAATAIRTCRAFFDLIECHKIFANEKYFNIHYNKAHGGLLPVEEEPSETDGDAQPPEEPLSERLEELKDFVIEDSKPKAPEQVVYYKCDLCKILYPSEKAYNTHFDKKHGASCQETSTGYRVIEQQLTPCPPGASAEVYSCEFCPKSFNIKRSLQVHRKRVHFDQVKEADGLAALGSRAANRSKVCDICGRAYNSNAALRYHQRRHTGEKPYPCTICPKRFTMPMFLQIHMRTHTGEKPYACPHCPKAFTNKAALIRHDRVHSGVKPYPCPECGKFFTQSNSMKLHVSTVHLKLPAPYKSRSRRRRSEARALQLALKGRPTDGQELILGE